MKDRKAIILYGPRQVGKTTLLQKLEQEHDGQVLWLDGDDAATRELLAKPGKQLLKRVLQENTLVIIDEAQRLENTGLLIKIIVDQFRGVKVIASGSSAFELSDQIREPLTGRKWEFQLLPFAWEELVNHYGYIQEKGMLETRLVYGMYPEIVTSGTDEASQLKSLAESYLYKDILKLDQIKKTDRLEKLVQAIAWQAGNEISYSELGQLVSLDPATVEKYILLLERAYIVFRLPSLARNLRNELKKSKKIYFWDNGIRNAVIDQFQPLGARSDKGVLWENFMISERLKRNLLQNRNVNSYFWRTKQQQEIDYVEESGSTYEAFEFKWSDKSRSRPSLTFTGNYDSTYSVVSPAVMEEFLLDPA